MADILTRYFKKDAKRIPFGNNLTPVAFEEKLAQYYKESEEYPALDFDLSLVEWVSLLELLLLIQWINHLTTQGKRVRVVFPYTAYIDGIDDQSTKLHHRGATYDQIYRRQKASDFLCRLQFHEILREIKGEYPIVFHQGKPLPTEVFQDLDFQDPDPFQERLLSLKPFKSESELEINKELTNEKLRNILKTHSCLDPVDSGMLADVAIKELASNAIQHGIWSPEKGGKLSKHNDIAYLPAWISARLVKSSWRTKQEAPQWLSKVYNALLGKHYVELAISDPGFGIYTTLKDHIPKFVFSDKPTVKGILDYAFDKFSSSRPQREKDLDRFPTGLFLVYNLVKDNGGVLILRSSGFFMAYDFLNNKKDPRLLDLLDETGQCIDVGGTAIQIILPESRGIFDTAPLYVDNWQFVEPEVLIIDSPDPNYNGEADPINIVVSNIKEKCQKTTNVPIILDMLGFDLNYIQHTRFMLQFIRYVLYLENPNLILSACF